MSRRWPPVGEPDSWWFFAFMMALFAATQAAIVVNVALGRLDATPFEVAGSIVLTFLMLVPAGGFWHAYRFSLVDVPMTMSWWRTSTAKTVVVLSLLTSAGVEAAMWISGLRLIYAMTAVLLAALALIWWRGFPDDGREWEDVPTPDPDPAISKPQGK